SPTTPPATATPTRRGTGGCGGEREGSKRIGQAADGLDRYSRSSSSGAEELIRRDRRLSKEGFLDGRTTGGSGAATGGSSPFRPVPRPGGTGAAADRAAAWAAASPTGGGAGAGRRRAAAPPAAPDGARASCGPARAARGPPHPLDASGSSRGPARRG